MNAPLLDLRAGARRRTRWAVVVVLLGVFVTVLSGAISELLHPRVGIQIALLVMGLLGLATIAVAVWSLVHWVNEHSTEVNLTLATSHAVLWRWYPDERRLEFVAGNPAVVGATQAVITDAAQLGRLMDKRDADLADAALEGAIDRGDPFSYSYRTHVPSRGLRQISVRASFLPDRRGRRRVLGVSWDETETRAAALRAERTGRLYATLGAMSRVTRSADSIARLYEQACLAAVEAGGFPLVWIGVEDKATGLVHPVAQAGPTQDYLEVRAGASANEGKLGLGPIGRALAEGQPVWSNAIADDPHMAPWQAAAARFGLQSVVAVPMRSPSGARGVFVLYADSVGFFSASERSLLMRLGDDLTAAGDWLAVREEQRRQRDLLTAIVSSAPVPIIGVDPKGQVRDIWNAAAEHVFGWLSAEVMGRPLPFVPPEEAEASMALVRRVLEGEVIRDAPVRRRRQDGTVLDLLLAAAPLHDARGRVTGILGVMMDQTERVAAEARVRESEVRFRQLSEQAADVVYRYRLHPNRGLDYVNPAIEKVLGYTPDELYQRGDGLSTILHADEKARFLRILAEPESVEGQHVVLRWQHREGHSVWVEHRGSLMRDEQGRVVAVEGIARDVTERRGFEEELARLSRAVEQTTDAVVITDPSGTIVYVNPAFEALTGWARDEAIGQNSRILNSGEQSESYYAGMWADLVAGRTFTGRVTNRRKDGTLYLADLVISPVRDVSGTVVNYVGIQRDVTRQHELEDQLRQSQKMQALGQLTGGIAHDFNNLLTIILSNAGLLADALTDRPALQQDVETIRAAAGRGARVVRQLMQFGRRERLDPVVADLGAAVVELVHTFRRVLPESLVVRVDVEDRLPRAMADVTAVEQMLLNLATNARDAMPDGGELTFTVRRQPGESRSTWVVVTVHDTGMGMSREVASRVFEPFYTTKPAGKGTGLGLAMVYGLMEQHGGRVTVYSEPGLGTTFRLFFPAAPADAHPAPVTREGDAPHGAGERILLVEDEDALRDVGRRVLERLGYGVVLAAGGAEALDLLARGEQVDLMLTDVVMPEMTGSELAVAVRARGHAFPIVFTTGYAAGDVLASLGKDALLVEKPWTITTLALRLRQALGDA